MINLIKRAQNFYKVAIILTDLVLINLAIVVAFLIKFNWDLPEFNFKPYLEAMPFITIAALVYFDLFGMLKFFRRSYWELLSSIVSVVFLLSITTVAITYFKQGFSFPRSVLIMSPILQVLFLGIWKGIIVKFKKFLAGTSNLMIIGEEKDAENLLSKVKFSLKQYNLRVSHVYSPKEFDKIIKNIKNVEEVFICSGVTDEEKMKIISHCLGSKKVFYIVPQLFEISLLNSRIVQFDDVPAFVIDRLGLTIEQRFFKRVFDVVFSIIGIILTSPIMLMTIVLIKLTSKGKAIYSQERFTVNSKIYNIYKFRTMYEDAEKETGPVISGNNDPRITPVGKYLRKFRIDELPQFFNVLTGDMSLVGPRAERPHFVEQFEKDIPEYAHRSSVKAGITGFAQVLGNYDTLAEDKLRYDLLYIKNYSLMLDIKLILQTIRVVITGKNISQKSFYKNLNVFNRAINF